MSSANVCAGDHRREYERHQPGVCVGRAAINRSRGVRVKGKAKAREKIAEISLLRGGNSTTFSRDALLISARTSRHACI